MKASRAGAGAGRPALRGPARVRARELDGARATRRRRVAARRLPLPPGRLAARQRLAPTPITSHTPAERGDGSGDRRRRACPSPFHHSHCSLSGRAGRPGGGSRGCARRGAAAAPWPPPAGAAGRARNDPDDGSDDATHRAGGAAVCRKLIAGAVSSAGRLSAPSHPTPPLLLPSSACPALPRQWSALPGPGYYNCGYIIIYLYCIYYIHREKPRVAGLVGVGPPLPRRQRLPLRAPP